MRAEKPKREAAKLIEDDYQALNDCRCTETGGAGMEMLIRVIFAVAYLVCPIDLIPDFIPVAGQIDDLVVVLAALLK
jgi:uncharacterized membrane protein YkvA (DUF1232 family)